MNDLEKPAVPRFDKFANNYDEVLKKSLGSFATQSEIFAKYKIEFMHELLPARPRTILEFGCGIGRNLLYLQAFFPQSTLYCCDLSRDSLKEVQCVAPAAKTFISDTPDALIPYENTFDVVFISNVLHHIPPEQRQSWMKAITKTIQMGGHLFLFEHNPWNPLTRHIVNTCPFDEDAELVWPRKCATLLKESGLKPYRIRYTLLFPWRNAFFVTLEKMFNWLAAGAQYCLKAEKV